MKANCLIREQPHYRRDAFLSGLRRVGYDVGPHVRPADARDLLIIWNRYGSFEQRADAWEAAGGTVLVAENGYVGSDEQNHQLYAISAGGHNGSGWFPQGFEDRFAKLGLDPQPWQSNERGHFLVCGQRGIGSRTMASPGGWHEHVARFFGSSAKLRLHPGNHEPVVPLKDDLKDARACVIWSSSSGVKALLAGIPVIFDAPFWICMDAARRLSQYKETPSLVMDDSLRYIALQKMAWAQWTVSEISSGTPFALFLEQLSKK